MNRVVVIGAGPAGLMAALAAARVGADVRVIAHGWGSLYWHAGCVDVLGFGMDGREVTQPLMAVRELIANRPDHPYGRIGEDAIIDAVDDVKELCAAAGYPLVGSMDRNTLIPTAVGGVRASCLVPSTMMAGETDRIVPTALVGFRSFADLTPSLLADNLLERGIPSRAVTLDLPTLRQRKFVTGPILAAAFEQPAFRSEVVSHLKPTLGDAVRVGFPAVLGLRRALEVSSDLGERLGVEVFEVPVIPPSIPGMRLHSVLVDAVKAAGGRVANGMRAVGVERDGRKILAVLTESAARQHRTAGDVFVLATGGLLGGGIVGYENGEMREVVMDLPVQTPPSRAAWFQPQFAAKQGHSVFTSGVLVDEDLRPAGDDGSSPTSLPVPSNVFVAGATLGGADSVRERSVEGIALATGNVAGANAASQAGSL